MATISIHEGSLTSLPPDASPGLLFLKALIPILDSLSPPPSATSLAPFMSLSTKFIFNGMPPATLETILPRFASRGANMSVFRHDVKKAWDIASGGKRTLMYESVSISTFKADEEGKEIEVPEFSIIELEQVEGEGLRAVECRTYMDASPVMQRMAALKSH